MTPSFKKTPRSVVDRYTREKPLLSLHCVFISGTFGAQHQLGLLRDSESVQSLQAFSSQPRRLPSVIFVSALASEPHLCYVNYFFSHLPEWWRLFLFLLLSPEAAGMKRLLFSSGIWA